MKNIYLSTLLILLSLQASATHLMGGEILIHDLHNGKHVVTLMAYRDTVGIPMALSATFNFSGPNGQSFSTTTDYDSIISGNLLPMYPYGVEIYLFIDTVIIPSPGLWEVSWSNCCRNAAIQNLSAPLSETMLLKTSLLVDTASPNSTPFFIVPAAIFLPLQTPWQYNPLPFDVDGDSLHWRLDTPLTSVSQYCAGYTDPASDTSNPFSIDPVTGSISWTANTMGNFVATILVDQFRNGQWMGNIRRDMQFIVVNPGLGFPQWGGLSNFNKDSLGHFTFDLIAGEKFTLNLWAQHSNSQRMADMDMGAFSEIFLNANNQATFKVYRNAISRRIQGVFNWTPDLLNIRQDPYLVSFRISDGYFTDDQTFRLKVQTAVGIKERNPGQDIHIYPNPASEMVFIELHADGPSNLQTHLYDITGREVLTASDWLVQNGINCLALSASNLKSGIYILQITDESGKRTTQSLRIAH